MPSARAVARFYPVTWQSDRRRLYQLPLAALLPIRTPHRFFVYHLVIWCAIVRRVFKTRTFARWSRKAPVSDATLCAAAEEMAAGLIDADLGGGVYKKRVAMPGRGKSGGARVLIGTNLGSRWFFMYGFRKNERATIDDRELAALQKAAAVFLAMDQKALDGAVGAGELTEICHEERPHPR